MFLNQSSAFIMKSLLLALGLRLVGIKKSACGPTCFSLWHSMSNGCELTSKPKVMAAARLFSVGEA
jgi:hypothetical protein